MRVILFILLFSSTSFASHLKVNVDLSPAGDFAAETSALKGSAKKIPGGFVAQNIVADFRTLETGVGLRDSHTKKHLKVKEFPQAVLLKAKGKNGSGLALIKIMGQKHKIRGTYKIKGSMLKCNFKLKLSQLGITGIKYMGVGVLDEVDVHVEVPIK